MGNNAAATSRHCNGILRCLATEAGWGMLVAVSIHKYRIGLLHNTTINSSGDEIANVNFIYDNIEHALQNTIDSCINSNTDRRGYVLEKVYQIQWNNAM